MQYYNEFPKTAGASVRIVTGGDINRPDPAQSCKLQTTDPLRHGPNIDHTQYSFTPIGKSCDQASLETFAAPPEPGSQVITLPDQGNESSKIALAVVGDINSGAASAGNLNNMGFPGIVEALARDLQKIISNGVQTASRDGAEIKKVVDGAGWTHNNTQGIPTHAASYPLGGTVLHAKKNIDTAIQQFGNILGSGALSQLAGQAMSLASAFQQMTSKQKSQATKNMPPEVSQAFSSMVTLLQTSEGGSTDYMTSNRVDPETYIANLIELLSQAKTYEDLLEILHRANYDESLFGLENLANTEISFESAYGSYTVSVDSGGNSSHNIPDTIMKLIAAFLGMLQSAQQAPSAGSNINLFRDQAETISNMLGRIHPAVQKFRQEMLTYLNTSGDAEIKKQGLHLAAWEGGNPLSVLLGGTSVA